LLIRCSTIDEKSGATATSSANALLAFISERNLTVEWILDTHPHAGHFSAAAYLKERTDAKTAIGERITDVQLLWKEIYNMPPTFKRTVHNGTGCSPTTDIFHIGDLEARVLFSPGHTLASTRFSCPISARRVAIFPERRARALACDRARPGPARSHAPVHGP
jgi:glyoxylase-like metal-dependent hydrolase (beta-lactamase superfamily II)